MDKDTPVMGRKIQLGKGRHVWVSHDEREGGGYFVQFKNEEGEETNLVLSKEALTAIGQLASKTVEVDIHLTFIKGEWQPVSPGDDHG